MESFNLMREAETRVLVIEDDPEVASVIREVLEYEGHAVHTHHDGECLDVVREFEPDVIVCDYMLPLRNGQSIVNQLRAEGVFVPFIMVSAARQASSDWHRWGVDAFVPKPFDIDHLITSVNRLASRYKYAS